MIDTKTPLSDGWWLETLHKKLVDRREGRAWSRASQNKPGVRPGLDLLASYLEGDPPLPQAAQGWKAATKELTRMSRMNYAELVVGAVSDRLVPGGWTTALDSDGDGDALAQQIARANGFGTVIPELATKMMALADGYLLVGAPRANGIPTITVEDPRLCITAHNSATGDSIAGLKVVRDEWTDRVSAYLYLPGRVHVARCTQKFYGGSGTYPSFSTEHWSWDEEASGPLPGLAGRMPLVRAQNRYGKGEYEVHLDVLDRINDAILSRVITAKIQAFRQRAIEDLPDKDEEGNEIDYSGAFVADPGGLWRLPTGAKVWESGQVDLGPLRMTIKDDVEGLAAATRTALHYITPDAASGSAEGASTMKEAMVFRVEDRRRRLDSALSEAMSLAFQIMGETDRSDASRIRTIWLPAERYSITEKAQADSQASKSLPFSRRMTDIYQYPPSEVPALQAERASEALYDAAQQ